MYHLQPLSVLINPRRAWTARVTVIVLCVCLLSHIWPLERLLFLKMLSCTQRETKVKKFVSFSSETAPLQRSSIPSVVRPYIQSAILKVHALTNEACQLAVRAWVWRRAVSQSTGKHYPWTRAHATTPKVCTLVPFVACSSAYGLSNDNLVIASCLLWWPSMLCSRSQTKILYCNNLTWGL